MQKIGLLGGMSWESTREYYRIINEEVRRVKGGLHSAPILLESFDFAPIAAKQTAGEWAALELQLASSAQSLEQAGAKAIVICTNYMHRCAVAVQAAISIPLLHIADAIGKAALAEGATTLGLLGASGTMEHPFYREHLEQQGFQVIIPEAQDRAFIHRTIFEELCCGVFLPETRARYVQIMQSLQAQGAQGIILGCTEIEQLVSQQDIAMRLYPSAKLHAEYAAAFSLQSAEDAKAA